MDALRYFARRKLKVGGSMELGLSYIVNPVNVKGLIPFAREISKIGPGIDFVRFTPTLDFWGGPQHSQKMFNQAVRTIEKEVTPYLKQIGTRVSIFYHRFQNVNEEKPYQQCLAHPWFAEIGPDGGAFLCCELNLLPEYRIGNLVERSLSDIWKSPERMKVVTKVNESQLAKCPTFCKPHELNKIFHQIENFRKNSKMDELKEWLTAMQYLQDPKNKYSGIFEPERTVAI
jgi:sulfatase maturation enzyme AslB (radical SAM superfamily)